VRLVESCNLIDQLNAGRLVVVFGSGFKETDLVAFGRDLTQRNALYTLLQKNGVLQSQSCLDTGEMPRRL
jgi:hypothetical protein